MFSCDLQEIQEYTMFQKYQNTVFKLYKLKFLPGPNEMDKAT
jgi:hypothetical protein